MSEISGDSGFLTQGHTELEIYVRSTVGVERDLNLVRHFVQHYRDLGVSNFRLILHAREEGSIKLQEAIVLLRELGLSPAAIWITKDWDTGSNAGYHRRVVEDLPSDAWIVSTDIDEFHFYPTALPEFTRTLARDGVEVVRGRLIDRVTREFRITPLREDVSLMSQFPVEADFWISNPGNPGKIMLHRNYILTTPGHDSFQAEVSRELIVYPVVLKVAHFKWFKGVEEKYTDPALIAHHSDTWVYPLYQRLIRQNFTGVGRIANLCLHTKLGRVFRGCVRGGVRSIRRIGKSVLGSIGVGCKENNR